MQSLHRLLSSRSQASTYHTILDIAPEHTFALANAGYTGFSPFQYSPYGVSTASDATPIHPHGDPAAATNSNQEKAQIGFALVGLGQLSLEELVPAFRHCKLGKLTALVSGDAAKAAKVASENNIPENHIYNYQNFDEIKYNPDVDVVYIVLPNHMHEEFTVRAARAGKHVLCEKPMSTSAASAQRMIDACEKEGRKLMIAYRIQFEPKNGVLKEWTRAAAKGKVRLIEMVNVQKLTDPTAWRLKKSAGGGPLFDIGIYCLNTARYLLGTEPEWVSAQMYSTPGDPRFKEVEEAVLFQMGFPDGVLVNATSSFAVEEERHYRCLCDEGWYGLDKAFAYKGLTLQTADNNPPQMEDANHFSLEMDHMADCVLNNKKPYTPGEEGLQDHKIIEAIFKAAADRQPVLLEKIKGTDNFRGK